MGYGAQWGRLGSGCTSVPKFCTHQLSLLLLLCWIVFGSGTSFIPACFVPLLLPLFELSLCLPHLDALSFHPVKIGSYPPLSSGWEMVMNVCLWKGVF